MLNETIKTLFAYRKNQRTIGGTENVTLIKHLTLDSKRAKSQKYIKVNGKI